MRLLLLLALAACEIDAPTTHEKYACTASLECDGGTWDISGNICGDEDEQDFIHGANEWLMRTHAVDGCHDWYVDNVKCTPLDELCTISD